jgi:hypothetical protein
LTDVTDFFNTLVLGQAAMFYLLLFVGIAFLITYKIRYFAFVSATALVFQGIYYLQQTPNTNYVPEILTCFMSAALMLYFLAGVLKR